MMFAVNGANRSNNNLVRVRSPELVDRQFGAGSPANTPYPVLDLEETQVEVYFSPDDGTITRLLELVRGAEQSMLFMAYSFTDDD
jgi:hypothetical protein